MPQRRKRNKKRHTVSNTSAALKKPSGRVVLGGEEGEMSNRVRRDLKVLKDTMAQYSRVVEQHLAKTGTTPRASLIASAAKYYPTLKKLAEK